MRYRTKRIWTIRLCELASFLCCLFIAVSLTQEKLFWTLFFIIMTYTNYRNAVNLQIEQTKEEKK